MRHKRPFQQDCRSTNKAICALLFVLLVVTLVSIVVFECLGSFNSLSAQKDSAPSLLLSTTVGQSADLGFAYPQLAKARQLLTVIRSQQQLDWPTLSGSYNAALAQLLQSDGSSKHSWHGLNSPESDLKAFLDETSNVLAAGSRLLQCHKDDTLMAAWLDTAAAHANSTAGQQHSATGDISPYRISKHHLLAANFHNSAAVLPDFVIQTIHLAVSVPPGHLAVSVYESGSSDTSRMWLTLLHYLLLPLQIPHNITTAGVLSPRLGLSRIELLARLRNALIEPWLGLQQDRQQQQQQHTQPTGHDLRSQHKAAAGSAELSFRTSSFTPDSIIFANDVFWCAEDVMRLLMHDAHIACGMDFYTAPWQEDIQQAAAAAAAGAAAGSSSVSNAAVADDDGDDDFFDPVSLQLQQINEQPAPHGAVVGTSRGAAAGRSAGGLRFYDKWVARDISGRRLRNRHPFIQDEHSSQQLIAGHPVPMRCCWNGLAVVAAAPFLAHGVRFRSHQPGECAASECSLLCDDFYRLGYKHVVMDPAVRLAYEVEQVNLLGGTAAVKVAEEATTPAEGDESSRVSGLVDGLGPWLPWAQVAAVSAQISAQAQQDASACQPKQQMSAPEVPTNSTAFNPAATGCGGLVECCDLRPGRSYVDFRLDCHMIDILAQNFTAQGLKSGSAAAAQAA